MKTSLLFLFISFLLLFIPTSKGAIAPSHDYSKIEMRTVGAKGHPTAYSQVKTKTKSNLKKKRLRQVLAKAKAWLGDKNKEKRKGTKHGLISLGLSVASFFLLGFFGSFSIVIGILIAIVALVFSIINLIKSFQGKERLWPAILSIIIMIPIIFFSLFFIACHDGCF